MVIQSKHRAEIFRSCLRGFQRRQHVGSKLVHNSGIDKIPLNAGRGNVGGAIVLFAGVNVERKARNREQGDLPPLAVAVNRNDGIGRQDIKSGQRAQPGYILTVESLARKLEEGKGRKSQSSDTILDCTESPATWVAPTLNPGAISMRRLASP